MPAMAVPHNTPSLAWLKRTKSSPNDRLAIKSETVNPIPPNKLIPVRLAQFIPVGRVHIRDLMASQVNR